VVVYCSGHGSIVHAPEATQLDLQYAVPSDCEESSADDFRGIASVELSIMQARLTERTPNVTVILDCCHAGFMSRDARMHVRWRPGYPYSWLKSHLDRLSARGLPIEKWSTEGNKLAVRVAACTTRQVSFEYDNDQGVRVGVLTESLAMALAAAGKHAVTFADVMDLVRRRIVDLSYDQRPTVEGPANRLLFSTATADLSMSLPVRRTDDGRRLRLECADRGQRRSDRVRSGRPAAPAATTNSPHPSSGLARGSSSRSPDSRTSRSDNGRSADRVRWPGPEAGTVGRQPWLAAADNAVTEARTPDVPLPAHRVLRHGRAALPIRMALSRRADAQFDDTDSPTVMAGARAGCRSVVTDMHAATE
jgi:Caspase domain